MLNNLSYQLFFIYSPISSIIFQYNSRSRPIQMVHGFKTEKAHDYDKALTSLKSVYNLQQIVKDQDAGSMKKLSNLFINHKKNRLIEIFVQKVKQYTISRHPPQDIRQKWETKKILDGIQGIKYNYKIWYLISSLHILVLIILLFLNSFCGFVDRFAEEEADEPAVVILKIFSLAVLFLYFFGCCTKKTFQGGIERIYLRQIILAYFKELRIFIDFASIVLTILLIALPLLTGIGVAGFFLTILNLGLSLADLLQIQMMILKTDKRREIWNLLKVALFNILFAHSLATVLLGMAKYNEENNWLVTFHGENYYSISWFQIYVTAIYWASTIMMSVGFGEITPNSNEQRLTITFIQIFSCVVLAYNVTEIGNIISNLRKKNEKRSQKMNIYKMILANHQKTNNSLNPVLQKRIYSHIRQELSETSQYLFVHKQSQFLESLPQNLRLAYYREAYQPIFSKIIFFQNLKPNTLGELAKIMENKFFFPENQFQTRIDDGILILQRGKVSLTYKKIGSSLNGTPIDYVQSKQNEVPILITVNFLYFLSRKTYDVMAETHCHIWKISNQKFLQAISKSKIDKQFYYSVLHKHSYQPNPWDIIQCPRCKLRHTSFQCPKLHYFPIKSHIIEKYQKSSGEKQQRNFFNRRDRSYGSHEALVKKKKLIQLSEQFYQLEIGQIEEFEEQELLDKDKRLETTKKQHLLVSRLNDQKLKATVVQAIREYLIGYADEFWDIESDCAANYDFYFPLQNPNRLLQTAVQKEYDQGGYMTSFIGANKSSKLKKKRTFG